MEKYIVTQYVDNCFNAPQLAVGEYFRYDNKSGDTLTLLKLVNHTVQPDIGNR